MSDSIIQFYLEVINILYYMHPPFILSEFSFYGINIPFIDVVLKRKINIVASAAAVTSNKVHESNRLRINDLYRLL